MCLVIDANVFSSMFDRTCSGHDEFEPIREWLDHGPGFIVYGGSKYKKELLRLQKYHSVFVEYKRKAKLVEIQAALVDEQEEKVSKLVDGSDCDDAHLIAIFRVSKCRLLCSNDKRSDKYVKNRNLYLKNQKPPKIYRRKSQKHLLCIDMIITVHENLKESKNMPTSNR